MGRFLTDAFRALTDRLSRLAARVSVETRRAIVAALVGVAILGGVLSVQITLGDGETAPWRLAWWDTLHDWHHRGYDPAAADRPVLLLAIDEAAQARIGRWPWPRTRLGELLLSLKGLGASAIALDILLVNPDPFSPNRLARQYAHRTPEIADSLAGLGDSDVDLSAVMGLTPAVIAMAGEDAGAEVCDALEPNDLVRNLSGDPADLGAITCFMGQTLPYDMIGRAAKGIGSISIRRSDDAIVRNLPVLQNVAGVLQPLLSLEALRVGRGVAGYRVVPEGAALALIPRSAVDADADAGDSDRIRVERDGSLWMHYRLPDKCRYINALQIWDPEFNAPAGAFVNRQTAARPDGETCPPLETRLANAIVFVTVTGQGSFDTVMTPIGGPFVGTEILAQAVEQMRDGTALRRPFWLFQAETALLALLGVIVIVAVPRVAPGRSVAGFAVGGVLLLGLSWIGFRSGVLIDGASVALGTGLVAAGMQAMTLIARDAEKRSVEIVAQRKDAELTAAKHMQESLLPARLYSDPDGRGEIACHIRAAREVGGDFYDYFPIDARRLFFSVGDVSGKGMEASQFMLLSKTLWKSAALRADLPLDVIQETANSEIERDNPETMFVTAIVGVLDLETGALTYSSAGHDSPFVIDDGTVRQLAACGGPPAGLIDGIPYPAASVTLGAGARLVVFSDGISEAMDRDGALYGLDRLRAVLAAAPGAIGCADLRDLILDDVARFTGEAEQSDDITLVVVTWEGAGPSRGGAVAGRSDHPAEAAGSV